MKIFLFVLCILLPICYSRSPKLHHFYGIAMEMPYHIQISGSLSRKKQADIESIIASSFSFIHACFDHWNPKSELSLLNQLPVLEKKRVSPKLLQLFSATEKIITLSEGRFNPALGLVIALWKQSFTTAEKVDQTVVESFRKNLEWNFISIENGIFSKSTQVQLDFDGIAKGFGIDLLLERLQLSGYNNVYVDWAGDIAVCGNHPNGRNWQVAIRNPLSFSPDSEIIPLSGVAIATSGDYEQHLEIDGKHYCHIINPHTLYPIEIKEGSIASVTVMAPSCVYADGLATTAMTFLTIEDLLGWARTIKKSMPSVAFWIFERDQCNGKTVCYKHRI